MSDSDTTIEGELQRIERRLMAALDKAVAEHIPDEAAQQAFWRDPATWVEIGGPGGEYYDAVVACRTGRGSRDAVVERATAVIRAVKTAAEKRAAH